MRTRLVTGFVVGTLGIVATACSPSSGGSSNPYPDVTSFCAAVAQAECQKGGAFTVCAVGGVTQDQCAGFRESECEKGAFVMPFPGSKSALSRGYTSGNVQPCIDALNAAFTNGASNGVTAINYDTIFGSGGLIDKCEAVFAGTAGDGATCQSNYDCSQSGEVCAADPLGGPSQCRTPTPRMLGAQCRDTGDQCQASYCDTSNDSTKLTCVALVADGQPCTDRSQCQAASHCMASACAPKSASGQPCASNDDCDQTGPQPLLCDVYRPGGAVCAPALVLGGDSDDCKGYFLGQGLDAGAAPRVDSGAPDTGAADAGAPDAASGG